MSQEIIEQAVLLCEKGDYVRAKSLLSALLSYKDPLVQKTYYRATEVLLRRSWKQGKWQAMELESGSSSMLSLAIARLKGQEALQDLAHSTHADAELCRCFLIPSIKEALLHMRTILGYKEWAEGWIAFLKGDYVKAKSSFVAAEATHPLRSKVALFLLQIIEDPGIDVSEELSFFIKMSVDRFPHMAALLGRKKQKLGDVIIAPEHIYRLRRSNDISKLEKIATTLHPSQKEEKGWVYARIGDLYYAKGQGATQANVYWTKASRVFAPLELDMHKRRFLAQLKTEDGKGAFLEYFHALYRKNPELSDHFLQQLMSDDTPHSTLYMPIPFFLKEKQSWTIARPSKMLVSFAVFQYLSEIRIDIVPFLPHFLRTKLQLPEKLVRDFVSFEAKGSLEVQYLEMHCKIAILQSDHAMHRRSLYRLLCLCQDRFDYLMPQYLSSALATKDSTSLQEEVKMLLKFFPTSFDLLRLQCAPSAAYVGLPLSAPLLQILELHKTVDLQQPLTRYCIQNIMTSYGQDFEADWRFWHIALQQDFPVAFSDIEKHFTKNVGKEGKFSDIISHILPYQCSGFSLKFLDYCKKKCTKERLAFFLLALKELEKKDVGSALDYLKDALDQASSDASYKSVIIGVMGFLIDYLYGEDI